MYASDVIENVRPYIPEKLNILVAKKAAADSEELVEDQVDSDDATRVEPEGEPEETPVAPSADKLLEESVPVIEEARTESEVADDTPVIEAPSQEPSAAPVVEVSDDVIEELGRSNLAVVVSNRPKK